MGSPASAKVHSTEKPLHRVRITQPFFLSRTEVTQKQWLRVMKTRVWTRKRPYHRENPYFAEGSNLPATQMSHSEAEAFCRKLNEQEEKSGRLRKGWKYALPTEAQWEYAGRAGTATAYSFGDDAGLLARYAWFDRNSKTDGRTLPHNVGGKQANPFGLHDMHGNASEWCNDISNRKYYTSSPVDDPPGPRGGTTYQFRGGSFASSSNACRSASRAGSVNLVPNSSYFVGLRVAMQRVQADQPKPRGKNSR